MSIDLDYARQVFAREAEAIRGVAERIGPGFASVATAILECRGRVVVTGMGKAGIIGQKIAATLSSTGTPALFMHPAEAVHGDLGAVQAEDLVLALSNSGETEEVLRLLPAVRRIGARVAAITASAGNSLGKLSDMVVELGEVREACPLGLAPSASTAAMLAAGDALALSVQKARGFTAEQYALYHPAGELGRKLLRVDELMRTGAANPTCAPGTSILDVLSAISAARAGAMCVVDGGGKLLGIFTDGDFRRRYARDKFDPAATAVDAQMTARPVSIGPEKLAHEALALMRARKIDELPVVDAAGRLVGMLDVQDLLGAGLV
ncbi:MAG TPA: KpsF/GutQ family sugar-phosphate isomerase [Planctomycetota bacterium]|nr:KpsF/GutQ family sugar-phosphate isomerase [Planctomycetota bacterium]